MGLYLREFINIVFIELNVLLTPSTLEHTHTPTPTCWEHGGLCEAMEGERGGRNQRQLAGEARSGQRRIKMVKEREASVKRLFLTSSDQQDEWSLCLVLSR